MTDADRKAVTEWLGEYWHEVMEMHYTEDYGNLYKCSCGHKGLECELTNRTFTSDSDFFACFNRLVELRQWDIFFRWMNERWFYSCIGNPEVMYFEIWYHGKNPDGTWRLCSLIREWRKEKKS